MLSYDPANLNNNNHLLFFLMTFLWYCWAHSITVICNFNCVKQALLKALCLSFSGRYFDEISQDTGKYCFGVEDTLKALEMGAVEILIVYENLDTMRYVLRCHGAEGSSPENGIYMNISVPLLTNILLS